MFHWSNKRIEGHICLCYIAFTLLNHTLLKLESSDVKTTENKLRKLLDKMQVSLIEHDAKEVLLRSSQQPDELLIQQKLEPIGIIK